MTVSYNNDYDLTIFTRDGATLDILDVIQEWTEFHIDLKWCDMDTWSMKMPTPEFMRAFHLGGDYGKATTLLMRGIAAYRNQEVLPLISGPITSTTRDWNGSDDTITLNGMSDKWWLTARVAYPDYNYSIPTSGDWIPGYPEYSGFINRNVEDAMKSGCMYWWGTSNPHVSLRIPYFVTASHPGAYYGNLITYWMRWETAFEFCKKICQMSTGSAAWNYLDADMTFHVIYMDDYVGGNKLWMQNYIITDLSNQVMFGTDLGTVRSFSYTENRPQANVVYGGGPDFDPATSKISQEIGYRLYCTAYDTNSMDRYGGTHANVPQPGRIEEFFDCGSVQTSAPTKAQIGAAMVSATAAEIKKQAYSATATINLEPSDMVDFGQIETGSGDFRVGCKVAVQLPDMVLTDVIREAKLDFVPGKGEVITPIVCDPMKFYNMQPLPFTYQNRWQFGEMQRNWK